LIHEMKETEMIESTLRGDRRLIRMADGENRLNLRFATELDEALQAAEADPVPLVLTGDGKFFSNGLDLGWMGEADHTEVAAFFDRLHTVLGRLLVFPAATVAAINGHAFGAGLMLAAAADFRVMRADRGYVCFPEVDLGLSMSPQFEALCVAKLPRPALLRAWLSGARYDGGEALQLGLVDATADADALLDAAAEVLDAHLGKDPDAVQALKLNLYRDALGVIAPSLDLRLRQARSEPG
jgi:Delta3-Delta2-enoyl-CoA isomerase